MSCLQLDSRRTILPKRHRHTWTPLDQMQQIFQATKLREFPNRHWVLCRGEHVEDLGPAQFKERISEHLQITLKCRQP